MASYFRKHKTCKSVPGAELLIFLSFLSSKKIQLVVELDSYSTDVSLATALTQFWK